MAKIQTLDWQAFMAGKVEVKKGTRPAAFNGKAVAAAGAATIALCISHVVPVSAHEAITAMAAVAPDASFTEQLSVATKPIKDVLFGFAHEIYFFFMAWGALEALISKPQQGFTRMKVSTAAYILLYWVPWIVDQVNKVIPPVGY
ncbi:hypothetical protein J31TS4_18970 [Paenibacillus sp. J31TS4]|uniref:hypothetical protein n=1 Tax=Paenibacillus sp. J31TS4 TaxID=2807195 RepID=UPI001B0DC4A3|nr:hypothetical protein [Paenibacillus sp. J31TS4]GIP38617.1 hypothetical protein J31TS4_18970 [Paenibacillus sp. J31TS4]